MDNLEFHATARRMPTTFHYECLEKVLSHSHGEPTMSDEETKSAILHLRGMILQQNELIEMLVTEVVALKREKRSRWNPFKK